MYLQEEIQSEALVRNLSGFARFLPIAALFHGQVLNAASLARDAGVARNTVLGYLDVLEDTLLTFSLPAFEARLRVRERRHPKLYWTDPGLPRALKKQLDAVTAEERGHLFEGFIAGALRAYRDYSGLFDEWWYWAPGNESSVEVDFVLRKGRQLVAVEVKSTAKLQPRDYAGVLAIAELKGITRRVVVYLGSRELRTEDGAEVWPLPVFLDRLARGTLF
jgi:predicted AAA+ superfamily ATPase